MWAWYTLRSASFTRGWSATTLCIASFSTRSAVTLELDVTVPLREYKEPGHDAGGPPIYGRAPLAGRLDITLGYFTEFAGQSTLDDTSPARFAACHNVGAFTSSAYHIQPS